jgi:hypothetical protein
MVFQKLYLFHSNRLENLMKSAAQPPERPPSTDLLKAASNTSTDLAEAVQSL